MILHNNYTSKTKTNNNKNINNNNISYNTQSQKLPSQQNDLQKNQSQELSLQQEQELERFIKAQLDIKLKLAKNTDEKLMIIKATALFATVSLGGFLGWRLIKYLEKIIEQKEIKGLMQGLSDIGSVLKKQNTSEDGTKPGKLAEIVNTIHEHTQNTEGMKEKKQLFEAILNNTKNFLINPKEFVKNWLTQKSLDKNKNNEKQAEINENKELT